MMEKVIEVSHLTKEYKNLKALMIYPLMFIKENFKDY